MFVQPLPHVQTVTSASTAARFDVTVRCPLCHTDSTVQVDQDAWWAWRTNQLLLQQAFPTLTADQREQLLTGVDAACWATLGPPDDEAL